MPKKARETSLAVWNDLITTSAKERLFDAVAEYFEKLPEEEKTGRNCKKQVFDRFSTTERNEGYTGEARDGYGDQLPEGNGEFPDRKTFNGWVNRLRKNPKGRKLRRPEQHLIRDPEAAYTDGWYMCVPRVFNTALDLKQEIRKINGVERLTWVQGSLFSFAEGQVLYDTEAAHKRPWGEALKVMGCCIQVRSARPCAGFDNTMNRLDGEISFDVYVPNESRSNLVFLASHALSQDAFVRLLIEGPSGEIGVPSWDGKRKLQPSCQTESLFLDFAE